MITRRGFGLLSGTALPFVFSACTSTPRKRTYGPADKITLGCIGCGMHGISVNLRNFLAQDDARILAVCDVFRSRAAEAKKLVDAAYGNTACRTYTDFREILSDPAIDAVVISTPEHWHITLAELALKAGKDVFCEKPTKYISEGFAVRETARRCNAVFQTGLEDRSLPGYHRIVEWCRNGAIGPVRRVEVTLPTFAILPPPAEDPIPADLDYNLFVGPAQMIPYNNTWSTMWWRGNRTFGCGSILDWGSHLFDTAQLCANAPETVPVAIEATGWIPENSLTNVPNKFDIRLGYSNGVEVHIKDGGTGIRVIGEKGWIENPSWNSRLAASDPAILKTKYGPGESTYRAMPKGEHRNFLDCVRSREQTTYPVEAMHTIHLGLHAADISIRLGRKLRWDPAANEFIGDPEANRLAKAPEPRSWERG